ncbi:YicC/YloC family endoribonuclease [Maritimibacter fusiformis]|uniref:YicC family protein n=1 Tax=Maritimibacter fusiformis TaxID=2603819 RepID=A0A5D0RLM2_9RHOB|nr:YicC/YloC family endoribonuclease [Maritimibacter fusiformis]TYB81735.1 YicC family protein [Maritimibacter fusiformis]
MTLSMTGFASLKGHHGAWSWTWDMRSVNARGLDIRLRLPDWIDGLEPLVRKAVAARVARGSVSITLRLSREDDAGAARLNPEALERTLAILSEITHAAEARGLMLNRPGPAEIAAMRGVMDSGGEETDPAPLVAALGRDLPPLLDAFDKMRRHEGAALAKLVARQLDDTEELVAAALVAVEERREVQAETLRAALARVMDNTDGADPDRVAQELAMIAVKSDVREELDRLTSHVAQARALLAGDQPRGRKLDFLMQEFNREANTLCSKAQYAELTRIGLDLKALIDQMREQVQNIE